MKKTGEEEEGKGRDGGGQESKGRKEAKGGGGKKWVFLAHVANEEFSQAPWAKQGKYSDSPDPKVDSSYLMQIRDS